MVEESFCKLDDWQIAESYVEDELRRAGTRVSPKDKKLLVNLTWEKLVGIRQDIFNWYLVKEHKGSQSNTAPRPYSKDQLFYVISNSDSLLLDFEDEQNKSKKQEARNPPEGSVSEREYQIIHHHLIYAGEIETLRTGRTSYWKVYREFKRVVRCSLVQNGSF